jgi:hypothetical protein
MWESRRNGVLAPILLDVQLALMHLSCDPNGHILEISLTNEPILLAVAPHSEGFEFLLLIGRYRGIVEEVVFERLGRLLFSLSWRKCDGADCCKN